MMKNIRKLTSRGDTIVEVMIVLAVLGLAISICYATANRSLMNARQAQENSEASELVSSQIEQIRANSLLPAGGASSNSPFAVADNERFCFKGANRTMFTSSNPLSEWGTYPNDCVSGLYHIAITRVGDSFRVTAYWDSISGNGQDTVTMSYRPPKVAP